MTEQIDIEWASADEYLQQLIVDERQVDLIYIDPPFGTMSVQKAKKGQYTDDMTIAKLTDHIVQAAYILKRTGSIFVHVDHRLSHQLKVNMDDIFGVANFRNEIIWSYDFGGRGKRCWPKKHDSIFWYTMSDDYTFNYDDIDRLPYMAPGLCGPEKAAKGKIPTDVWWQTIVPTNGKERTGYPNQKPLAILKRIVKVHSNPGDTVLDFFAGSGTTGQAALELGRKCILVDQNQQAISVMRDRLTPLLH